MTDDQQADFEERAAIIEYDGKEPRDVAERRARAIVLGTNDTPALPSEDQKP